MRPLFSYVTIAGAVIVFFLGGAAGASAESSKVSNRQVSDTPLPVIDAAITNSVAGTNWTGTDSDGDTFTFTFESDGRLSYKYPRESSSKGSWKQFGNAVYFEANEHFSEGIGEIRGQKIEGTSWNQKKHTWQWTLMRSK